MLKFNIIPFNAILKCNKSAVGLNISENKVRKRQLFLAHRVKTGSWDPMMYMRTPSKAKVDKIRKQDRGRIERRRQAISCTLEEPNPLADSDPFTSFNSCSPHN